MVQTRKMGIAYFLVEAISGGSGKEELARILCVEE